MANIVKADFNGFQIGFNNDGWINATEAAAKFGKEPAQWLRLQETAAYMCALQKYQGLNCVDETELNKINELDSRSSAYKVSIARFCKKSGLVKVKGGSSSTGGGTWLHPKLAVVFARWLSIEFAIWCDIQIDQIIRSGKTWTIARRESALGYKLMSEAVKISRETLGKDVKPYHFINEARLINGVITGAFKGRGRDDLGEAELELVTLLEGHNALLLANGAGYQQRKAQLQDYVGRLAVKALQAA